MARRVGIYPGSFDPVHPGHIAFGIKAMRVCTLDEVAFVPERSPRGKPGVMDLSHRIALLELVTMATTGLHVVSLASEQFTVLNTLPELRQAFEGADLTLLVGSDVARTFTYGWDRLDVLLGEACLAIGLRQGDTPEEMSEIMHGFEESYNMSINYTLIDTEQAHMSSTRFKGGGLADTAWPNPEMVAYIQQHGLYGRGLRAD